MKRKYVWIIPWFVGVIAITTVAFLDLRNAIAIPAILVLGLASILVTNRMLKRSH